MAKSLIKMNIWTLTMITGAYSTTSGLSLRRLDLSADCFYCNGDWSVCQQLKFQMLNGSVLTNGQSRSDSLGQCSK